MTDLNALLERVKAATGPDRELDGEIDAVLRVGLPTLPDWARSNFPKWKHVNSGRVCELHDSGEHGLNWASQPFTASIDAAIALTERVLPGWQVNLSAFGNLAEASVGGRGVHRFHQAPTAPLAILTATLQALIAKEATS